MSILVQPSTKVLVQGITGSLGAQHAMDYGTRIGTGGQLFL